MPKDNINRAISKSEVDKNQNFQSLRYEGFGPNNVALIMETLTENKNRTAASIRAILQKHGGNLGNSGSTAHFFYNCGVIQIEKKNISDEKALEFAVNIGAKDCKSDKSFHEIITKKEDFYKVKNEIEKLTKDFIYSNMEWRPYNLINIPRENFKDIENMLELLQEDDDVQNVFHNCKLG
jgi:YebC/PmpR family DNA-binding regulatory protein